MNISANAAPVLARACHASFIAAFLAFAGCSHVSVRQATAEYDLTSALDMPAGVTAPMPVHSVAPQHPFWALRAGVEGDASVMCFIDDTGALRETSLVSASYADFGDAALAAVKQWRFAPGTLDGRPIGMRVLVPVRFRLNPSQPELLPVNTVARR